MKRSMNVVKLICMVLFSTSATAATITWNGNAGDWDYANENNWSPRLPIPLTYQDGVIFSSSATAGVVNVNDLTEGSGAQSWWPNDPEHQFITFQSSGWTLSNDIHNHYIKRAGDITSQGSGINTIEGTFVPQNNKYWTVDPTSTLKFEAIYMQNNDRVTLLGGGTSEIGSSFTGYGDGNAYGIDIQDGTLKINSSSIFAFAASDDAYFSITGAAGRLVFQGTTASAESLFGDEIIDGVGSGLAANELGGGLVEVVSVPEPATMGLMLIGLISILPLVLRRR